VTAGFQAKNFGRNDFGDEQEVRDRWWHVQPGEVVIDVGSAIGSYTLPALACGAIVIAMCPQRIQAAQLLDNIAVNEGFGERCIMIPCGLYDRSGWLWCDGANYHFLDHEPAEDRRNAETFPVMRLDDLDLESPRLDWIKIDVEGAEAKVLAGAEQTIRRFRPRLLVENHLFMDPNIQDEVRDLVLGLDIGYEVESVPYEAVSHSFFRVKS
jgi:FkbM family methyltransferase